MVNCLCVPCWKQWRPKEQIATELKRIGFKPNTNTPSAKFRANEEVKASGNSRGYLLYNCIYGPVDEAVNCGQNSGLCLGNISVDEFPEDSVVEAHSNILRSSKGREKISEEKSEIPFTTQRLKVENMVPLETVKTSAKLKSVTRLISPVRIQRQMAFSKKSSRHSRHQLLSDWGESFDLGDLDSTKSDYFSSPTEVGFSGTFSGIYTTRDSRLSAVITRKSILVLPGQVVGMFILKGHWVFQILKLNSSLDEVVDKFLVKESGVRLPLSFSRAGDNSTKNMSINRMGSTLAAILGKDFDAKTQGLVFASGAVNSELCYKMTVCALREIKKIVSCLCPENLPYK